MVWKNSYGTFHFGGSDTHGSRNTAISSFSTNSGVVAEAILPLHLNLELSENLLKISSIWGLTQISKQN